MAENNTRDYGFDNIRFVLMFCVILGHLLEFCQVWCGSTLYRLIYLFHMPCFLFLSGYFTKDSPSTFRLCKQIVQYIIFQTAYLCFARYCLGEDVSFQYTTPYWILWYFLVSILYPVFLHGYRLGSPGKRSAAVVIASLLALLTGFDESVGYYLSLSRLIAFQPFFLLGYWWRNEAASIKTFLHKTRRRTVFLYGSILLGLAVSAVYALKADIANQILYRSLPYSSGLYSFFHRAAGFLLAFVWILFFMLVFRHVFPMRIPLISRIGANTLPVYLFHGFIMRILRFFHPPILDHYLSVILVTLCCLLLLGNPLLTRLIDPKPKKKEAS